MIELDGALGILPTSAGDLQAILGDAQSGPTAAPAAFARIKDVVSTFGSGPLVEHAAYALEHYGKPLVLVRTARTTLGASTNLVTSGVTGTSVITLDATVHPVDDQEIVIKVTNGGTIGVAGITLTYSLDGGRTTSPAVALGTANTYTVPNGGPKYNLAAGTLVTGDTWTSVSHAPLWSSADLSASIDALAASKLPWEYMTILGDATGADQDTVDAKLASMHTAGKHKWAQLHFRMPNVGESDAAYQTAFSTSFSSYTSINIERYAGAAQVLSSISFRQYRRPALHAVAPLYSAVSQEQDVAQIKYGPLPGVQIRDGNGNLLEHDEFEQPGLDDLKATTLRTWNGRDGVFVNNPRIACPVNSDFQFVQYRRVMNIARTTLQAYLELRTSKDIVVNATTGFIVESEAKDIESGANAALEAALLAKPKASAASFVLSRTDNLLSTQTLTYQERIVPLGYAKTITGDIAFNNPAIRAVT